jgi:hypothetical protein
MNQIFKEQQRINAKIKAKKLADHRSKKKTKVDSKIQVYYKTYLSNDNNEKDVLRGYKIKPSKNKSSSYESLVYSNLDDEKIKNITLLLHNVIQKKEKSKRDIVQIKNLVFQNMLNTKDKSIKDDKIDNKIKSELTLMGTNESKNYRQKIQNLANMLHILIDNPIQNKNKNFINENLKKSGNFCDLDIRNEKSDISGVENFRNSIEIESAKKFKEKIDGLKKKQVCIIIPICLLNLRVIIFIN